MKYKIVGVILFIIGIVQLIVSLIFILQGIFTDNNRSNINSILDYAPLLLTFFVISVLGLNNIFLATRLFSEYKQNYFSFSLVTLILTLLIVFYLMSILGTVNNINVPLPSLGGRI
jgi:hypothetical protein